jgi:hypothetical protein
MAPCAGDLFQIALQNRLAGDSCAACEGFERDVVQALALSLRGGAKGGVEVSRYVADGVLHAFIVGSAGIVCKQG